MKHVSDTNTWSRLWSVEKTVSNLTESLSAAQQLAKGNLPVQVDVYANQPLPLL